MNFNALVIFTIPQLHSCDVFNVWFVVGFFVGGVGGVLLLFSTSFKKNINDETMTNSGYYFRNF